MIDQSIDAGSLAPPMASSGVEAVRLIIAGGHTISRSGLRRLLESEKDFVVTGEAGSVTEAATLTRQTRPNLILVDVPMPGFADTEVVTRLCGLPGVKVLLLAAAIEKLDLARGLRLGIRGVIFKDTDPVLMFKAIRRVSAGQYWVQRETLIELLAMTCESAETALSPAVPGTFGLTPREHEIVSAVVSGHSNREIGAVLKLSEDTVKHHLTNIFDKTGVSTRLELALFAVHHRLVSR